MVRVEALLDMKGHELWSIGPDDTVYAAIERMDQKSVGALVVLHDGDLVGIVSERDYARKVILKGRSSKETKVRDIMTTRVYYTFADEDVEACMAVMTKHRIRHLPVLQEQRIIGMISIGDVVKHIIAEQRSTIEHLEHYISWEESY
jgi:CBS domain-containing protein